MLLIGTILVVECFFRLPLAANLARLRGVVGKIVHTMRSSKISDHWKERVLPAYAGKLFSSSIVLFAIVCLALSPMIIVGIGADMAGLDFMAFLMTMTAIVASTVFAILYVVVRRRLT